MSVQISILAGGNFPAPGLEPGSCAALPSCISDHEQGTWHAKLYQEAMHLCFINSGCHRRHGKLPSSALLRRLRSVAAINRGYICHL